MFESSFPSILYYPSSLLIGPPQNILIIFIRPQICFFFFFLFFFFIERFYRMVLITNYNVLLLLLLFFAIILLANNRWLSCLVVAVGLFSSFRNILLNPIQAFINIFISCCSIEFNSTIYININTLDLVYLLCI